MRHESASRNASATGRPPIEARASPGRERSLGDRKVRIRHYELGVDLEADAEPVARLAGAVGRVEREVPRLELAEGDAAMRAREVLGEALGPLLPVGPPRDGSD